MLDPSCTTALIPSPFGAQPAGVPRLLKDAYDSLEDQQSGLTVEYLLLVLNRITPGCFLHPVSDGYVVKEGANGAAIFSLKAALGCMSLSMEASVAFQIALYPLSEHEAEEVFRFRRP